MEEPKSHLPEIKEDKTIQSHYYISLFTAYKKGKRLQLHTNPTIQTPTLLTSTIYKLLETLFNKTLFSKSLKVYADLSGSNCSKVFQEFSSNHLHNRHLFSISHTTKKQNVPIQTNNYTYTHTCTQLQCMKSVHFYYNQKFYNYGEL